MQLHPNEKLLVDDYVRYMKFNMNMSYRLYLTNQRLVLKVTTVHWLTIFYEWPRKVWGMITGKPWHPNPFVFNLPLKDIEYVAQGKYGLNKNVLVVRSNEPKTYKILLSKKYETWVPLFKELGMFVGRV